MKRTARDKLLMDKADLLPMLIQTQEREGYLSRESIRTISRALGLSENKVYSMASFYDLFIFSPDDKDRRNAAAERAALHPPRPGEVRIALRNCGLADSPGIDGYIARDGLKGLSKALELGPEEVRILLEKTGLDKRGSLHEMDRSRGVTPEGNSCVICNAAQDDPESRIDDTLLEGDPYAVLEGLAITGYCLGADRGLVYIDIGKEDIFSAVQFAAAQMEERGFLGTSILGSSFNFTVDIIKMPATLVYRDNTAFIAALQGERPVPQPSAPLTASPQPADRVALIADAEIYSGISAILLQGMERFTGYGTPRMPGTKILTLTGDIALPGVVEIPTDMTLRQIIFDIGGGMKGGRPFKAVRVGGPTGGWLSESFLDMPIDNAHLRDAPSILGSGTVTVVDNSACAIDLARRSMEYLESHLCGKCVFCREGTMQLTEILTEISEWRSKPHDMDLLLDLGKGMSMGSLCLLGREAANPVLTAIRGFREEFEAHIGESRCPAHVCRKLETAQKEEGDKKAPQA